MQPKQALNLTAVCLTAPANLFIYLFFVIKCKRVCFDCNLLIEIAPAEFEKIKIYIKTRYKPAEIATPGRLSLQTPSCLFHHLTIIQTFSETYLTHSPMH